MYILITVTTLLMLLAIITSTRFEVFLTTMGIRNEYEKYMTEEERRYYNSVERKKYEKQQAKSKSATGDTGGAIGGEGQTARPKRAFACAKLNVGLLFEEGDKSAYADFVEKALTRLIENTYAHRKFFKETNAASLVTELIKGGKKGTCGGPLESVNDMAQIAFDSSTMREVYYLMIKGSGPKPADPKEMPNYYPSLFEFLTFNKNEIPVRVYLAKRPLLLALFAGPDEVNKLIEARAELLRRNIISPEGYEITSEAVDDCETPPPTLSPDDTATLEGARQSFEAGGFVTPFDKKYLDFSVSATTPPND